MKGDNSASSNVGKSVARGVCLWQATSNTACGVHLPVKGYPMNKEIDKATEAFLNALTAKEQAEQAHEEARELLVAVYAKHGVETLDYEEINIKLSPSDRRSFDIEKLRDLISAPLFRTITKPSVDTPAWDRAVREGKVPTKVVKAVVSVTSSVRVLVRPAKGAVKPTAKTA